MARTPSNMIPLHSKAPDFSLLEPVTGNERTLKELKSDTATVLMFICNHCPFVKHVQEQLVKLANDYIPKGISFIAISSNNVENYPDDSPEKMKEDAERFGYPFPYLYDETQEVAKAYEAACTPDFYIYDGELKCVYRGQLDDSRPENGKPVTGEDIRRALDQILNGESVDEKQKPSIGCNIKWKA
ncbi:thioredoxin family protein [Chengkuizengella axinellae]|uniref:Thioredoxin family protein n=1 Tax=Chengkuizengella axinellae TaxID=3064388 RepID=A0ABT9IXV7_9BACL|nr:thioredoxin family protein [Chengkuizengella sp. 2205SS18-9]MDP5274160.1 thioredoxin family protein [Chengkuizengella sp. 2205SS18-9]